MKASFAVFAAGLALATPGLAQQAPPPQSPPPQPAPQAAPQADTWRMPHERGFWGHVGVSFGQSQLQIDCPAAFSCDDKDQFWKLYFGGRFNNVLGAEFGVMDFGKFSLGGGETEAWGGDASIVAGFPFGTNSGIFAKVGVVYARTEVSALGGLVTGEKDDWGARWGIGAQLGLTKNWSLRADYDRYRLQFPGDNEEDIDALTLGVQYTMR